MPQVCFAPCYMRVSLRIERDDANVMLRVVVDGEMYRYSEIPLAPNSPTVFSLDYKDLPAGTYDVAADLVRQDVTHAWVAGRATGTVEVSGAQ